MKNEEILRDELVDAGGALEVGAFFGDDCAFDGANLDTNSAVDTGRKIDPIPIGAFDIFSRSLVDAGHWTSGYAIRHTLTNISHD
jgi:hypothetical protein